MKTAAPPTTPRASGSFAPGRPRRAAPQENALRHREKQETPSPADRAKRSAGPRPTRRARVAAPPGPTPSA